MQPTADRPWTAEEEQFLADRVSYWTVEAIARHLGRTVSAVRHYQDRRHCYATTGALLTSGWAARLTGLSPQYLTQLARSGRLAAHRVPGGRWWLFAPDQLPGADQSLRRRLERVD